MPSAIARTAEREDLGFTRTCRVAPAGWSKMMSGDKASGSLVEGVMGRGNDVLDYDAGAGGAAAEVRG